MMSREYPFRLNTDYDVVGASFISVSVVREYPFRLNTDYDFFSYILK